MTASVYKWSDAYLRTDTGNPQTIDGGIAIDPTHPGFARLRRGTLACSSLTDSIISSWIPDSWSAGGRPLRHQHYHGNPGLQSRHEIIAEPERGQMFLSESIAPIFPYQYANSRRIYCDAAGSINDTQSTMQAVNYGWWLSGRLYQFNDPDMMKFAGVSANENQSRLINCAIAGTVFLNGDDLASAPGRTWR